MKFKIGAIEIKINIEQLSSGLSLAISADGRQGNLIVDGWVSIAPNNQKPFVVRISVGVAENEE